MGFEVSRICADECDGSLEPVHGIVLFLYGNCDKSCRIKGYIIVPLYG